MTYSKYTWQNGQTITADKLNHIEDGIAATTGGAPLESTTYAELIAKRNSGTLTPGMQYRITDYVCTTTQAESRAVSHPFDVIVVADDESTLNENARACLHEGDNYYSAEGHRANLEAWEVKYCIDNDTNRFAWADTENGKGVIFYLKDERGNECPYDFKQIQFKRYKITECSVNSLVGKYTTLNHGRAITAIDEQNPVWCYTFSVYDSAATEVVYEDASIMPKNNEIGCIIYRNVINPYYYRLDEEETVEIYYLNNIVFFNTFKNNCSFNIFGNNCSSNTFGNSCYSNTFGDQCSSNTFGNSCSSNTFRDGCSSNTFGNGCGLITFGNSCSSNTFGNGCVSITFGVSCGSSTFGNNCSSSTFGDQCGSNTFGNNCSSSTFGNSCYSNTFGNNCIFNTFGNNCQSNTFGDFCYYNIFENDCHYIDLSEGMSSSRKQYYHVLDGTQGTYDSHIQITGTNGNNYVTYVGKNSSGTLKTWVPADLAQ